LRYIPRLESVAYTICNRSTTAFVSSVVASLFKGNLKEVDQEIAKKALTQTDEFLHRFALCEERKTPFDATEHEKIIETLFNHGTRYSGTVLDPAPFHRDRFYYLLNHKEMYIRNGTSSGSETGSDNYQRCRIIISADPEFKELDANEKAELELFMEWHRRWDVKLLFLNEDNAESLRKECNHELDKKWEIWSNNIGIFFDKYCIQFGKNKGGQGGFQRDIQIHSKLTPTYAACEQFLKLMYENAVPFDKHPEVDEIEKTRLKEVRLKLLDTE